MDSINQQQPEDNHEDLGREASIARIRDVVAKQATCFFCTVVKGGRSTGARPMSVREVDDDGNLWFLSANDSHKNLELDADPHVWLFFQPSAHANFLQLHGRATISRDRERIEALWDPLIRTWFTEGKEDPRITVVKVRPDGGYYWDNKHGTAVAGLKMIVGAALGKTLDDSIEGRLSLR